MAKYERLEITGRKQPSAAAKYSQNFQTFAQMEVAVYERNIILALQVSANFKFGKMFIHKISLSNCELNHL
jgi:hypothetical protein